MDPLHPRWIHCILDGSTASSMDPLHRQWVVCIIDGPSTESVGPLHCRRVLCIVDGPSVSSLGPLHCLLGPPCCRWALHIIVCPHFCTCATVGLCCQHQNKERNETSDDESH